MAFKQALLATFLLFLAIHSSEGEGTLGTINEEKEDSPKLSELLDESNEPEIEREWNELVGPKGSEPSEDDANQMKDGAISAPQKEEQSVVKLSWQQKQRMKEREWVITEASQSLFASIDCKKNLPKFGLHIGHVMNKYCDQYKEVMNNKHGNPIEVLDQFLGELKEAYAKEFGEPYAPPAKLKLKMAKSIMGLLFKSVKSLTVNLARMVVNTKERRHEKRREESRTSQKEMFQTTIAKLDIYLAEAKAKIEEQNSRELQSGKDLIKQRVNAKINKAITVAVALLPVGGLIALCVTTVVGCIVGAVVYIVGALIANNHSN